MIETKFHQEKKSPKKLKAQSFVPPPLDEGDEFYPNGIFVFNVTKLLKFVGENPDRFPVEEIDVAKYAIYDQTHLDEATVKKADIAHPILLAEISPGRFNVIDGNHRLERARRIGQITLPAFKVRSPEHVPFLASERAYTAYVQYWNEKVEDFE